MTDIILDSQRKQQLDANVKKMAGQGYPQPEIDRYIQDFTNTFGKKKEDSGIGSSPSQLRSVSAPPTKEQQHAMVAGFDVSQAIGNYDSKLNNALHWSLGDRTSYGDKLNKLADFQQSREGKVGKIIKGFNDNFNINTEDLSYVAKAAPIAAKQIVSFMDQLGGGKPKEPKIDDASIYNAIQSFNTKKPQLSSDNEYKFFSGQVGEAYNRLSKISVSGAPFDTANAGNEGYLRKIALSIDAAKNKEIAAIEKPRPVFQTGMSGLAAGAAVPRDQQAAYDKQVADIESKYQSHKNDMATAFASQFAANNKDASAFDIGMKYMQIADPITYNNRVKAGAGQRGVDRDILETGSQIKLAAEASPAKRLSISEYRKTLDDVAPQKKAAEVYHKIAAELYKTGNSYFLGGPTVGDVEKILPQLTKEDRDFYNKYIRSKEEKNIGSDIPVSDVISSIVGGFNKTVTGMGKSVAGWTGIRGEAERAKDILDQPYETRYQEVGQYAPAVARLDKLRSKSSLTKDEVEEKASLEKYTRVVGPTERVMNGMFDLAGQVIAQAVGTKGVGAIVKGAAGTAIAAETASKIGGAAVAYTSSYDDAVKQSMELGLEGWKSKVFAGIVAGANAATEHMFQDKKVLDAFKKEIAPNVSSFVRSLTNEGVSKEVLETGISKIAKNAFEYVKATQIEGMKEVAEETATSAITSAAIGLLAPERFDLNEAIDDLKSTALTTFVSGQLVAGFAGATEYRANKVSIPMFNTIGINKEFTDKVYAAIDGQVMNGDLTKEEAADKKSILSEMAKVNTITIPQVAMVSPNLNRAGLGKYAVALANEQYLQKKSDATQDQALKDKYAEDIKTSQDLRKSILNQDVYIDDNYNVKNYATQESTQQANAPESNIVQPARIEAGQPQVGEGEGGQGQGTQPSANVSDSNISGQGQVAEDDTVKISDVIGKPVIYKGKKAFLDVDGKTVIAQIVGENREYELGNIDEIGSNPLDSADITHEQSVVQTTGTGNVSIRGVEYVNAYSNPMAAINLDADGNVVSVNLETTDGNKRTFRGAIADDIAYQIKLKQIFKDATTAEEFDRFIESESAAELADAKARAATAEETKGVGQQVSREKAIVQPVQIAPAGKRLFNEPNPEAAKIELEFKKQKGIDTAEPVKISAIDEGRSKTMADAYESVPDSPNDPETQQGYQEMADQTMEQYKAISDAGVKVELWDGEGEPYKSSEEMIKDVRDNKHMYIFSTEQGFGETPITDEQRSQNALLRDSGMKDVNGKPLLINDMFRFVHDYFGHTRLGNSFGPIGEENAWNVHVRMYNTPLARRAMTMETRGQNSWVNFNKSMRNADGSIKKKGDEGYIPPSQRPFAEQKMGLFPEEFSQVEDAYSAKSSVVDNVKGEVNRIKSLDAASMDGSTINLDGTTYTGGGLVVPAASLNTTQEELTPEMVNQFIEDNKGKIGNNSFKVGLFKFEGSNKVSIDLNIIVDSKHLDVALKFAKMAGQNSIFNLDTMETIPTGESGDNPIEYTDEQYREISRALAAGEMPKLNQAEISDTLNQSIAKAASALKSIGIKFKIIDGSIIVGPQTRGDQAIFMSDTGEIIIDKSKIKTGIEAGVIVWHESAHPVMNIIRNTNRATYNAMVDGMHEAAAANKGVAYAIAWAQELYTSKKYPKLSTQELIDLQNDEALVEVIARIASGAIRVDKAEKGFKQQLVDFMNAILKLLGKSPINIDSSVDTFNSKAKEIAIALRTGRDVSQIVGKENVGRYEAEDIQKRITAEDVLSVDNVGKKKVTDVATEFEQAVDDILDPSSDPNSRISRFLNNAYQDLRYFFGEYKGDTGLDWYTNKVKEFKSKLEEVSDIAIKNGEMPEANSLRDKDNMDLFNVVLALSSIGINPRENVKAAFAIWKTFDQGTRQFQKYQPGMVSLRTNIDDGKGGYAAPSGTIVKETKTAYDIKGSNGKVQRIRKSDLAPEYDVTYKDSKGNEVTKSLRLIRIGPNATVFRIGKAKIKIQNADILNQVETSNGVQGKGWTTKGNVVAINLERVEKLLESKQDIKEAIGWINSRHPIAELREFNSGVPDVDGGKGKINPKGERYGSYIIGEKLGSFHQNVAGTPTELTMDLWWSRTWNRYMGTLMTMSESGDQAIQETPRTDSERNVMREAAATAANALGLEVHELQAALWYLEQQMYKRMGAAVESYSFVDGINKLLLGYGKSNEELSPERYGVDSSEADKRRSDAAARAASIVYGESGKEGKGRNIQASAGGRDLSQLEPVAGKKIDWEKSPVGKGDPSISSRNPIVVDAAKKLKAGKITNEEYRATVSDNSPISPITRFFDPATENEVKNAVSSDKAGRVNSPVSDNTIVGLRLDIPAYSNKNTWVVSVHEGGTNAGKAVSYRNVAKITDVKFGVEPKGALSIAAGTEKATIGRMFGKWVNIDGATMDEQGDNAKLMVEQIANDPSYVQVGMNPFRHSYFYDRSSDIGRPVKSADEVIQIGGLVYAKNPKYGNWTDEAYKVKGLLDSSGRAVQFSLGGRSQEELHAEGQGKQRERSLAERSGLTGMLNDDAETYFQRPNSQTKEAVNNFIDGYDIEEVADFVVSNPDIPDVSLVWMAGEAARRLKKEIESEQDPARKQMLRDMQVSIYNHFAIKATSLGQAVQAFVSFPKDGDAAQFFLPKIIRMLNKAGLRNVTDEMADTIKGHLDKISNAPDGLPKDQAIAEMSQYLSSIAPVNMGEILQAIWYAKILSGITTQSKNLIANIFNGLFEVPVQAVRMSINSQSLMPFVMAAKGAISGIAKGGVTAADIIKTGLKPQDLDKFYMGQNVLETFSWGRTKVGQLGGGVVGKVMDSPALIGLSPKALKMVGRALSASDALFSTSSKEAMSAMLAYSKAKADDPKSTIAKLYAEANNTLGNNKSTIKSAKAQAVSEGYKPGTVRYKRRVIEIVELQRPSSMVKKSDEFGSRVTLNFEPEGWSRPMYIMVKKITDSIPAAKVWMPFTRIVANLTEQMLDYSPAGMIRAVTGRRDPFGDKTNRLTSEERQTLAIKSMAAMAAIAILAKNVGEDDDDWFEITANGTGNIRKNYELSATGWRANTITLKDGTKIDYSNWPIRGMLSAIGAIRDHHKYDLETDDSFMNTLYIGAVGMMMSMYDSSLMKGLADFIDIFAIDKRAKYKNTKDGISKWSAQQVKSVAVSNFSQQLMKFYGQYMGDSIKEAKGAELLYREMPVINNGLDPIVDVFGDPVPYNTAEKLTPVYGVPDEKKNALLKKLIDNKVFIGVAEKKNIMNPDTGEEREMTDKEYYEYKKLSGQLTKRNLLDNMSVLDGILTEQNPIMKSKMLESFMSAIKTGARKEAQYELFYK